MVIFPNVKKRFIKWAVSILLLWLFYLAYVIATFPAGDLTQYSADVAIVLGAAVIRDQPSPVFEERIKHAINLYKSGQVSKLIFTGGFGENQKFAESMVARDYAINQGVLVDDIYMETISHTTTENLSQAMLLLKRASFKSSLIVSDPLHTKRAMMIAKDIGLYANPSATPSSRYKSMKTRIPFILREVYFYHHYLLLGK